MKILFILYHDFYANSAIQVHHFANALIERGCQCAIGVPENKETCFTHIGGDIKYTPFTFDETLTDEVFPEGAGPDIIFAWTPRELVREQCLKLKKRFSDSKLVIDLEDNEELILETNLGTDYRNLKNLPLDELNRIIPKNLSHPVEYRNFLNSADGVTVIMDTLLNFVPDSKPSLVLWPILDKERFFERKKSQEFQRKWKIGVDEVILAYVGNVHSSNWKEVRSLYLAVALANRNGVKTRLIRAGKDYFPFWGAQKEWTEKYTINLGLIPNHQIPEVLANADFLIQPGKADKFNNYRLPSKIPEFLAMKKPVALPNSNIGRFLQHEKEAIILKTGDALEILELIMNYSKDRKSYEEIAVGGYQFVLQNFSKDVIGKKLETFLKELIAY